MTAPKSSGPRRSSATWWGAVLTIASMLAAAVALAMAGWDVTSIIGLLAAVGAAAGSGQLALSKVVTVDERAQHIDERTATIERQTNGEMTATIHDAVRGAIAEHLIPAALGGSPEPVPKPAPKVRKARPAN